ncbi:MAG: hypothetical protein WKF96_18495 [Solirubrobacteraceae bacterium]
MAERKSLLKTIEVRVLDEPMRLFRIVPERPTPSFEDAFRSHYELGRPPRGPENRAAAIHMAISMFDRRQVAEDLAARVPKLGGHIAAIELIPAPGNLRREDGGTRALVGLGPSTSTRDVRGRC